ncbi:aspartate kinase [Larkinella arboricola]|uniref:Aspartokinase n=1 Tax=Larkinella arboricola TaxID=643671 RepID=A0A327WYD2_LARAB|nr:aspartate kinase [Larkinella arboricola]RAJ98179.1 aspartate kinase [Larkinella arboricola]
MQVFKFGGASVRDAHGVRTVAGIIQQQNPNQLLVVVSAMGETTNALEQLIGAYLRRQDNTYDLWQRIRTQHEQVIQELAGEDQTAFGQVYDLFAEVESLLQREPDPYTKPDQIYDQLVSYGELLSTRIVNAYLNQSGLDSYWVDARRLIRTDASYREGKVDWKQTCEYITDSLAELLSTSVVITQGFIGSTGEGNTTTLGRDGSDYTAAIFAHCLEASGVTIWKDVPGVLNADPKWFDETVKIDQLTYQDAIELAYYGATVIHPKTIKPLQNKNIPLYVRSFLHPQNAGTVIGNFEQRLPIPSFIFKMNQTLISFHPKDFSFIAEENLSKIFGQFAEFGVKINLMQNTAISFSVAVDNRPDRLAGLLSRLQEEFRITYNEGLELITIRHYDDKTIERVLVNKKLLVEQKSRYTVQLVVKDLNTHGL